MGGAQAISLVFAFIRSKLIAVLLGPAGIGINGLLTGYSGNIFALAGWGADWPLDRVMSVALLNYLFKWFAALTMTPLIYGVHHRIEAYLGPDLAQSMRASAHRSE